MRCPWCGGKIYSKGYMVPKSRDVSMTVCEDCVDDYFHYAMSAEDEHLVCYNCGEDIPEDGGYVENNGIIYCEKCSEEYAPDPDDEYDPWLDIRIEERVHGYGY